MITVGQTSIEPQRGPLKEASTLQRATFQAPCHIVWQRVKAESFEQGTGLDPDLRADDSPFPELAWFMGGDNQSQKGFPRACDTSRTIKLNNLQPQNLTSAPNPKLRESTYLDVLWPPIASYLGAEGPILVYIYIYDTCILGPSASPDWNPRNIVERCPHGAWAPPTLWGPPPPCASSPSRAGAWGRRASAQK